MKRVKVAVSQTKPDVVYEEFPQQPLGERASSCLFLLGTLSILTPAEYERAKTRLNRWLRHHGMEPKDAGSWD